MKKWFKILLAVIVLPAWLGAAEGLNVPPEIPELIAGLRDVSTRPPDAAIVMATLAGAKRSIGEADLAKAKMLESVSLDAKMMVLADAIVEKGEIFDQIKDFYITYGLQNAKEDHPGQSLIQVRPAPFLRSQHATQEFRLVWEFYAMQRKVKGALEYFDARILEALRLICDERSAIAVADQIKIYAADPEYNPTGRAWTLAAIPRQQTLKVIAECSLEWEKKADERAINIAEAEKTEIGAVRPPWFDEAIVNAFRKLGDSEKMKWRSVLSGIDVKSFRGKQLKLVGEIRRTIGMKK